MLRICHLASGDLWAGAEAAIYHLVTELDRFDDLEVRTIVLNEGRLAQELRRAGMVVEVIEESRYSFFRLSRKIRDILARHPPYLLHSHRYKENVLAFMLRSADQVIVATQHGLPENRRTAKQRLSQMGHFFLLAHRFDQVVSVSRDLADHLIDDFGLPAGKVRVIHNGIMVPPLAEDSDKSGQIVIGSCGRLVAVKDYPLMIEVAGELVRMTDKVRFMLAGEGPERARLEQMIRRAGLANSFILCGHIDDMPGFYRQLDIFMNTSSHEGIPVSILEAMSHGVPVIAPRVGGIGEIIENGVNGWLLDRREPAAFVHAVLQLLNDRTKRAAFAQAARGKVVRSYSAAAMAAEYRNLYLDLAARVKHRGDPAAALELTVRSEESYTSPPHDR